METLGFIFGITGMSFGVLGFIFGVNGVNQASAASEKIEQLEQRLSEAGVLSSEQAAR